MECGSHAAARKHGLRTPHTTAPVLRSIPVFDSLLVSSNSFSDSFLERDQKVICSFYGSLKLSKAQDRWTQESIPPSQRIDCQPMCLLDRSEAASF
jgi:hypothetical protein